MIIAKELLEVTNETLRFFLNASVEREKNVACQHLSYQQMSFQSSCELSITLQIFQECKELMH